MEPFTSYGARTGIAPALWITRIAVTRGAFSPPTLLLGAAELTRSIRREKGPGNGP